jgi:hypothetical protein
VRTRLQIACLCGTVLILNAACGGTRSTVSDETQSTAAPPAPPETPGNPREATAVIAQSEASFTIPVGAAAPSGDGIVPKHHRVIGNTNGISRVPTQASGFPSSGIRTPYRRKGRLTACWQPGRFPCGKVLPNGAGQLMRGSRGYLSSPGGDGIYAKARTDGSAISIIISDKTAIERLFAAKPAVVEVVARAPGAPEQRYSVPVSYQGR